MLSLGIDKPLPLMRSDIEIFSAPLDEDGAPTFIIHDPVSGTFSKIGWEEATVLKRLRGGQTLSSLARELKENTALRVKPDEIMELCEEARRLGLTMDTLVKPAEQLLESVQAKKPSVLAWLARHYLYFRIPLIYPDALLEKILPKARWLVSPTAKFIYAFLACVGLYFLTQRFESYMATFSAFTSLRGLIFFGAVIVVLKIAHELGHALVAKHYGLRVPTMGLALMVFFPVAYSDVTDGWRLRSRRQRMQITLAGVKVELVIGAAALALWGVTPSGMVNSLCFILSSTTLVSTLLVNLNPAMRFDGYYLLSDLWGIDNLSSQSTAYTKWLLWRGLLCLDVPPPMNKPSRRTQWRMVLYALYAWHYRLFLYLGIAVIVYHKFAKPLGITLFSLEIFLFIIRPFFMEMNMARKEMHRIRLKPRLLLVAVGLLLLVGWAVWPLPRSAEAPAIYATARSQTIYAHAAGQIVRIAKARGDAVTPGELLLEVESQVLDNDIDYLAISIKELRYAMERLKGSSEHLGMVPERSKQLASAEAELTGLMAQKKQLTVVADMAGVVADMDERLRPGDYVMEGQALGRIVDLDTPRIDAFVSEKDVAYIRSGMQVAFYPADRSRPIAGRIEEISPIREEYVDITDIGSVAVKEIPLAKDEGTDRMTFVESYYKVRIAPLKAPDTAPRLGTGGHVRFRTEEYSLALVFWRYCYSILIRESGF